MSLSIPQYKVPTIYVFTLPFYKNAKWEEGTREGKGILKIDIQNKRMNKIELDSNFRH